MAAARARADEVFEAVYRCQRITGRRGLQARGYLLGHGEVYDERHGHSGKLPYWRQGQADGQDYRWVGDPSHHNYSDAVHGLMQYYTLAAQGPQKERAREAIDALVSQLKLTGSVIEGLKEAYEAAAQIAMFDFDADMELKEMG